MSTGKELAKEAREVASHIREFDAAGIEPPESLTQRAAQLLDKMADAMERTV